MCARMHGAQTVLNAKAGSRREGVVADF